MAENCIEIIVGVSEGGLKLPKLKEKVKAFERVVVDKYRSEIEEVNSGAVHMSGELYMLTVSVKTAEAFKKGALQDMLNELRSKFEKSFDASLTQYTTINECEGGEGGG